MLVWSNTCPGLKDCCNFKTSEVYGCCEHGFESDLSSFFLTSTDWSNMWIYVFHFVEWYINLILPHYMAACLTGCTEIWAVTLWFWCSCCAVCEWWAHELVNLLSSWLIGHVSHCTVHTAYETSNNAFNQHKNNFATALLHIKFFAYFSEENASRVWGIVNSLFESCFSSDKAGSNIFLPRRGMLRLMKVHQLEQMVYVSLPD